MIRIYEDDDYLNAIKQYRRILFFFLCVTALYVILCIGSIVWNLSLPYNSSSSIIIKVLIGVITAIYVVFVYIYGGIKIHRSKYYCRMLKILSRGIKEKGLAYFSHIDDWETKDKVDVNVLVFKTWNVKKQKWDERNVYVDAEKELPEFKENEEVLYITQGNVLVEYAKTGNFYQEIVLKETQDESSSNGNRER